MKHTLCALAVLLSTTAFSLAQAQTIKVGTHPTFAPFEFVDKEGKAIGFDIDLINEIAKANGDQIVFESMPFDGLIPSLITGNIDVIISGMTITEARQKRVDFSDGYYNSNLSILIKKDKEDVYTSAEALKGKVICTQIGTTGHEFAKTLTKEVKALNNEPDAIMELKNGGCEAVINDRPVNLYYLKASKSNDLIDFVDPKFEANVDSFGIAIRKGNQELVDRINAGLQKITTNGVLDDLHIKWFGTNAQGENVDGDYDTTELPVPETQPAVDPAPQVAPATTTTQV